MPVTSIRHRVRFIEGPRDGEEIHVTLHPDQSPPAYWRHVTTIDDPMHIYDRQGYRPDSTGRYAWEYLYVGKSTRPAHKFSIRGATIGTPDTTGRW